MEPLMARECVSRQNVSEDVAVSISELDIRILDMEYIPSMEYVPTENNTQIIFYLTRLDITYSGRNTKLHNRFAIDEEIHYLS